MARHTTLFAGSLLLLSTAVATGEEWPCFRGPRGDGISRETGLVEKFPEGGLKRLWFANVGIGYASPVAVDGRVYLFSTIAEKDTLQAYDAESGKVLWTASYNSSWTGDYPGTRASPVIEGSRIYTYGGAGDLACWELANGKSVWQINVLKLCGTKPLQWGQAPNPLIVGNLIYVQGGKGGAVAVAINKSDGTIAWQSEKGLGGYTQPLLIDVEGTKQLIIFGGETIYAMNPENGKTIWRYAWKTKYDVNAATPVYRDGRLFCTSGYDHGCVMLKVTATAATKEWENKNMMSRFQGVILEGDCLYGNAEGVLRCLDWSDGRVRWALPDSAFKIEMGGAIVRVGDKLVILSQSGKLGLAKAGPEGVVLISQSPLVQGKEVWCTPLIYRGKLYAKGASDFVCVDFTGR